MKNKCKCSFNPINLLFFDKLVVPSILTFIYWLALVAVVLSGLLVMFQSILGGLISIVVGAISIRISFELICVVFNINRNLEKLVALQSAEKEPTQTISNDDLSDNC